MTTRSALLAALVVLAAGLVSRGAAAHGRFPAVGQIAFHPSDPRTIVARTTFGLLVSTDGGGQWRWICAPVTGASSNEDPSIAMTPDGSIVAAMFAGLSRGTDQGCSWGFPDPDLEGVVVIDLAAHPSDPSTLFAVTSAGDADNLVYRSADQGVSWAPTSDPIEPILFEAISIAPSDPSRIYLSGSYPMTADTPRQPFVHRSTDGGASWERLAFADFGATEQNIYVLGVDPADPEHVLMRVKSEEDDRLVRSTDGGASWAVVVTMPSIQGFAWSDDGTTVWVGGSSGAGLWRSDDGGETFAQIDAELGIGCLALRGDELWACGDNFTDGFAIGRSTDRGETFESMLLFMDVAGTVECAPESATTTTCEPLFEDLAHDLGIGEADGSTDVHTDPGGGGCGCRTSDGGASSGGFVLLFAVLACVRRRRSVG